LTKSEQEHLHHVTERNRTRRIRRARLVLIVIALLAAGFILREPVRCFVYLRSLPGEVLLYSTVEGIRIMNTDGTGRCLIAGGQFRKPFGSPDGGRAAFFDYASRDGRLLVVSADGSGLTPISPPEMSVPVRESAPPSWSPAGERLAFYASPRSGEPSQLYIWSAEAGSQPIPNTLGASMPFWSPDGERLMYMIITAPTLGNSVRSFLLYTIRPDGSERVLLADDVTDRFLVPPAFWSPSGEIAYLNNAEPSDLIFVDPQTGERRGQIDFSRFWVNKIIWSPDGAQIAALAADYTVRSGVGADTVIITLDANAESEATFREIRRSNLDYLSYLGWSADGASVFYQDVDYLIHRLPARGGAAVQLDQGVQFTLWKRE
jgi:Tol biopolymer transport system component